MKWLHSYGEITETSSLGGLDTIAPNSPAKDLNTRKVNTTLDVVDSKPRLILSEGSSCKATPGGANLEVKASTIVEFVCDTSIFGAGQPRLVGQLPPGDDEVGCSYFIEWKTHVRDLIFFNCAL
jgi:hypothetical protein